MKKRLKIAIIGSGISGLGCSWLLSKRFDVDLYEKSDYIGGHSNTQTIKTRFDNRLVKVDTGFIVFNELNYPNLHSLFKLLDVKTIESNMSFSVSLDEQNFEYGGENLFKIFAQKRNILNFSFWKMLFEIVIFNKNALSDKQNYKSKTIEQYLEIKGYSEMFQYKYLYPMASSIWSSPLSKIKEYPFLNFIEFFNNHGLLKITNRPKWKTVLNGSQSYIKKILKDSSMKIFLQKKVNKVKRFKNYVQIETNRTRRVYDHVVFACHSDQILQILDNVTNEEEMYLSNITYKKNIVYLHSDNSFMPKNKMIWSSWNYIEMLKPNDQKSLTVTYWMNKLQKIDTTENIFVTLNPAKIPDKQMIYKRIFYEHPVFTKKSIESSAGLEKIQGKNNTWFCGAYLGNGFHESGFVSGLNVAENLSGVLRPWKK